MHKSFFLTMIIVLNCAAMDEVPMDVAPHENSKYAFHKAIQENDRAALKDLITSDQNWSLALHTAAQYGRNECMNILLSHGADPNVETEDKNRPLHVIRTAKQAYMLTSRHAHVNARNNKGETPLSMALFDTVCLQQENQKCKESREIAQILLLWGADINVVDNEQESLLHRAVKGIHSWVVDFLLHNKIDVFQCNKEGLTAFETVVRAFCLYRRGSELLRIFEKYGMLFLHNVSPCMLFKQPVWLRSGHPDYKSQEDVSIVAHWMQLLACAQHNIWKGQSITKSGVLCNVNGCIIHTIRPADLGMYFDSSLGKIEEILRKTCQSVVFAIQKRDLLSLQSLITKFPTVVNYSSAWTYDMMIEAIKEKDTRYLKILLANNIDPHQTHRQFEYSDRNVCVGGGNFLHQAVFDNNTQAIELLMQYDVDCLQTNGDGQTPLEYAVKLQRNSCVFGLNILMGMKCRDAFLMKNYKHSKRLLSHITDCAPYLGEGQPLLHSILEGPVDKVIKYIPLLIARGVDVYQLNASGETPLSLLMRHDISKKIPVFEALLRARAQDRGSNRDLLEIALFRSEFSLAELFLQHGAIVSEEIVDTYTNKEKVPQQIKDLLRQKYEVQQCCICFEHPEDLSFVPCKHSHSAYICKGCYDGIRKQCPLCRGVLDEFVV